MPANPSEQARTLVDRLAVAFLSALLAFPSAALVWFILALEATDGLPDGMFPFVWVFHFTAVMAVLGFLLLDNLLASFYGWLWHRFVDYFDLHDK